MQLNHFFRACVVFTICGVAATLTVIQDWNFPRAIAQEVPATAAAHKEIPDVIKFNRDIRPLLVEHCAGCHGGVKQAGGLSVNFKERMLGVAESGSPIIVPRDPAGSLAYQRVTAASDDDRMPPADHGPRLKPEEIALLKKWIEQGAVWEEHWSFEVPRATAAPEVKEKSWVRQPLDAFILSRLEWEKLAASPEADRVEWLRRASFDLTGLPPTPAELDAFLADQSPAAYEAVVDRLLATPHFGERWASVWMDQARYADSQGYERDNLRTMWPYRDWLIRALNADMPYDQFILKQLAGDLLPQATLDDHIATAFHRNSPTNPEGGTDDEEFRVVAVLDRANTTWQAIQGVTFQCTQCHDHPYAAFKHEDYYRFLAFFNTTRDWDLSDDVPSLAIPDKPDDYAKAQKLDDQMRDLRATEVHFGRSLSQDSAWRALTPISAKSTGVTELVIQPAADGVQEVHTVGTVAHNSRFTIELLPPEGMNTITAVRLQALPRDPQTAALTPELGFVITEFRAGVLRNAALAGNRGPAAAVEEEPKEETPAAEAPANSPAADPAVPANPAANPPVAESPAPAAEAPTAPAGPPGRGGLRGARGARGGPGAGGPPPLDLGEEIKFTIAIGDEESPFAPAQDSLNGQSKSGWGAKPRINVPRQLLLIPEKPITLNPGEKLRVVIRQEDAPNDMMPLVMNRSRYSVTSDPRWSTINSDSTFRERRETLAKAQQERAALGRTMLLVMSEQDPTLKRASAMFTRGVWLDKGHNVTAGIPQLFGSLPQDVPADRLAMAKWLISPANPLMARVAVNRLWESLFGLGLVETQEDFGPSGLLPSHPELLDDLAVRYREQYRWSTKAMLKEMVLSATYRQMGRGTVASREKDPRNQLLSRGPRTRLTAEMVRDAQLAIGNVLTDKLYGPPVMPPQEDSLNAPYSNAAWKNAEGADRYRRAVYTRWRRSNAYPSLVTFDAPSRLVCVSRRIPTNTPLQALVALNDTVSMECSVALGNEMKKNGGKQVGEQLAYGYRRATSRLPDDASLAKLLKLYEFALDRYQKDAELSKAVAASPEAAALALVGNALLNLDDALSK